MTGRRSRSRSPIRRGGSDRRASGRVRFLQLRGKVSLTVLDRNGSTRNGFNQHSDKMVYLSNLPYEMTWMELKAIVREKAGEVNFVETLEDRDGRSKGCAVVEFRTKDSAIKCIEIMHRQELKGRKILAKEIRDPIAFFRKVKEDTGIDFLGSRDRQPVSRSRYDDSPRRSSLLSEDETYGLSPAFLNQLNIKPPLINRVFITNISFACGVGRLFEICSLAGKITWFDLQMDKEGKSKGMAVCEYSHPIEAVQAISMLNSQRVYDRTITVKLDRFEKGSERSDGELPIGLRSIGMGLGANGAPLADVASVISSISSNSSSLVQPQPLSLAHTGPFGTSVVSPFVNNNTLQQLQPFGNDNSVASTNSLLSNSYNTTLQQTPSNGLNSYQQSQSQPAYYGRGGMDSTSANSSSLHGLYGNKSTAFSNNSGPPPLLGSGSNINHSYGGPGSHTSGSVFGNGSSGGTYDSQASRVILIKNLPMDYTWQIVSDRVQQFGDLDSVEMISPGVAKIRFIQFTDAERAKQALQGTTVEGRVIGIEYL